MFGDWVDCLLGDVVALKRGYDLPQQRRTAAGVPIVSSSGVSGYHNEAKVRGPGVVTGRYEPLGEVFYVEHGCDLGLQRHLFQHGVPAWADSWIPVCIRLPPWRSYIVE